MPDMASYGLLTVPADGAFFPCRAILANVRVALIFTISVSAGGGVV